MQNVRFEGFTVVTMKKAVFWDVAPCRCGVNRRFRGVEGKMRKSASEETVRTGPPTALIGATTGLGYIGSTWTQVQVT
jgi:hypothetical protein